MYLLATDTKDGVHAVKEDAEKRARETPTCKGRIVFLPESEVFEVLETGTYLW